MPAAANSIQSAVPAVLARTAAAVIVGFTAVPAASSPFTSAPAGLREEVVLADSVVQGGRLDLRRFADPRSPEAVHEAVRRAWSERAAPVHSSERDGWLILTQVVGPAVETFEVRKSGAGSIGKRARLSRGGMSPAEVPAWLEATLPEGSRTIDRVTHSDGGRQMTTLVAITSVSAAAAARQVVSALLRAGFRERLSRVTADAGRGQAFFLARGSEDIALTVSDHEGQRAVVMHWGRIVR